MIKHRRFPLFALLTLATLFLAACDGAVATDLPTDLEVEEGGEQIEFTGTVESLGPDQWTVSGITFTIDAGTEIEPGLALGDVVQVHADLIDDDVVLAEEIELEDAKDDRGEQPDDDEEIEFTGVVELIAGSQWTIDGQEVAIDDTTEIKGAIRQGDIVKVHAVFTPTGKWAAREIELSEPEDLDEQDDQEERSSEGESEEEVEFSGVVDLMEASSWSIGGRRVAITTSTEIKGGISLGDRVKVHARREANGELTAREIEQAEGQDEEDDLEEGDDKVKRDEHEFSGVLQSIDGETWVVDGIAVLVTGHTEIEHDPQVGDYVKVEALIDEAGNLAATEIDVEDHDDDVEDDDDGEKDDDGEENEEEEDSDDDDHGDDHHDDEDDDHEDEHEGEDDD